MQCMQWRTEGTDPSRDTVAATSDIESARAAASLDGIHPSRNTTRRAYVGGIDERNRMSEAELTVTRDDAEGRYEIHVDGVLGGFSEFRVDSRGRLVFPHTVIDPAFRGRGLSGVLIERAMADVAARGETVLPLCPVVTRYLREHEVPGLEVVWPHTSSGGEGV